MNGTWISCLAVHGTDTPTFSRVTTLPPTVLIADIAVLALIAITVPYSFAGVVDTLLVLGNCDLPKHLLYSQMPHLSPSTLSAHNSSPGCTTVILSRSSIDDTRCDVNVLIITSADCVNSAGKFAIVAVNAITSASMESIL